MRRAAASADGRSTLSFVAERHDLATVDPDAPIPVPDGVALVGSDLDGTLLDPHMAVGPRALAAIPRLADAGVRLVYVTGRPPRWLRPVVEQTGHTGMAVCANGAVVVDLVTERVVRHTAIEQELALELVMRLRALVPGVTFAVERMLAGAAEAHDLAALSVVGFEPGYDPPWTRPADLEVAPVELLLTRGPVVKLLALPPPGAGHDADSLVTLAAADFADRLHITHSGARAMLIEIMAGEVDKGVALLEVAELLGIDAGATIGVGDMPNDVALLEAVGTGYAVANAHPAARAAADHVIPSNAEDGVGRLLDAVLAAPR
ncbi:MAG: Cof-type HAD-IIB family hydrolase [Candidatus Nanopelagicales bacterium]|jgi:Cof subfamily protein (haloacid dehalogenase superfamily)|nr:Cof-type HAD-IIB family hydrolase [Candidatus Nanopelagicales bacterium]